MNVIFDEYKMRELPPIKRLHKIIETLQKETDESIRWDCIWLAGEICEQVPKDDPQRQRIADLFVWVLNHDNNSIVKHEAAFQIGLRNMRDKIPDLVHSIMNDESDLVKHEAIEALGLLRDQQCQETLQQMLHDPSNAVRDTALFVIKRLNRLKYSGEYQGEEIM